MNNDSPLQTTPSQTPPHQTTHAGQALVLHQVEKSFMQGKNRLNVLKRVSFALNKGDIVGLTGPSGSGKSTLLNLAGLLEYPDEGAISIDGANTMRMKQGERALLRRNKIGFVFQFHRLLPEFNALENIVIPQMLAGLERKEAAIRGAQLLDMVGLADRKTHLPGELSGGEQQRVAIARAVANAPALLLADEPTGNLDPETAHEVFSHLIAIIRSTNTAALVVTHNIALVGQMDRTMTIRNGMLDGS